MGKGRERKSGSRLLRESTLKFLYACDRADASPAELAGEYWPLAQEHDLRKLAQRKLSALRELEPKRAAGIETLIRHEEAILQAMRPHEEADAARGSWLKLRETLDLVGHQLEGLKKELSETPEDQTTATITTALAPIFSLYQRLPKQVEDLQETALLSPPARASLEPVEGALDRLIKLAQAARAVEKDEIDPLQRRQARISKERERTQKRTDAIWAQLETIDPLIADAAENYRLERIEPIDRSILRQATYEMLHDEKTPPLVAIDEALELAKAYSSTESSAFINGILDHIYKTR